MPLHNSPTSIPAAMSVTNTTMGPGHDAIVLSEPESQGPRDASEAMNMIRELRQSSDWQGAVAEARATGYMPETRREGGIDPDEIARMFGEIREARRPLGIDPPSSDNASDRDTVAQPARPSTAHSLRFGPRPEPSHMQSRRSVLESYLRSRRSDVISADASTTLGRRVAARASGAPSPDAREVDMSYDTDDTAQRIIEIANNLQRDITMIAERRQEMLRVRSSSVPPLVPTATANENGDSLPDNALERQGPAPRSITPAGWRSTYSVPGEPRRPFLPSAPERRPRLPFFDRRGPSSGATTSHLEAASRPRDGAPRSATPQSAGLLQARPPENAFAGFEVTDHGSYRVRRSVNADGAEHVQNIMLEDSDDEDPFSWLVPREDRRRAQRLTPPGRDGAATPAGVYTYSSTDYERRRERLAQLQRSQGLSRNDDAASMSARPRRRGWARLDPDGNEIPTDEEEEYERARAQMRARAVALAGSQSPRRFGPTQAQALPPSPPQRRLSFVPTTQPFFWPGADELDARVRLNPLLSRTDSASYSDVDTATVSRAGSDGEDAPTSERSVSPVPFGSPAPFIPSPLPLPLVVLSPPVPRSRRRLMRDRSPIRTIKAFSVHFAGR
ncbi:hypothetical protein AcV5_004145 [Taiwanofungus camphoratus]|nr:hypothetical protein AcV5_004145 [Antrodia cinnamomea]